MGEPTAKLSIYLFKYVGNFVLLLPSHLFAFVFIVHFGGRVFLENSRSNLFLV